MDDRCNNCGEDKHIPDWRTGLIHKNGKYACHGKNKDGKIIRLETIAE